MKLKALKNHIAALIKLSLFCLFIIGVSCQKKQIIEGDLMISNVNIIDVVSGEVWPSKTVIITADTIAHVMDTPSDYSLKAPEIVDGSEKYLIPGLWDMHIHHIGDSTMTKAFWPLYLAHGITGVREMSGIPEDFATRDSIMNGLIPGPSEYIIGSPLIDGVSSWMPGSHHLLISTPGEAKAWIDTLQQQGFDFVKTYSFLPREAYLAIHERANELGMEVSGHIPADVSAFEAITLGHKTIEHFTGLELSSSKDEDKIRKDYRDLVNKLEASGPEAPSYELFRYLETKPLNSIDLQKEDSLFHLLAKSDTWVVPTLVLQKVLSYPEDPRFSNPVFQQHLHPSARGDKIKKEHGDNGELKATIDHRMKMVKKLADKDVKIMAGSDLNGGLTLHTELQLMVEAGLTPLEALQAATLNPAEYLSRSESIGTVEEGKKANLVVLNKNPLKDIRNTLTIEAVIRSGELYPKEQLELLREDALKALNKAERIFSAPTENNKS